MPLAPLDEPLRTTLHDASLNNQVACITLVSAAQKIDDEELCEALFRTVAILRSEAERLAALAREASRGRIRRKP